MTEQEFYKKVDGECHEDLIVFIRQKYKSEKEWEYTNQLYLAEGNGFVWQVDWHEGQEDVEILGYIPVREVEPIKHACCKDGKANYSEIPTSSTTKNDLAVDCISRADVLNHLANIAKVKAKSDAQKSLMGRCMFMVENIPSITPIRPKGHWIKGYTFPDREYWKCDKCNALIKVKYPMHYCNNCGSDNREVKE